jgi:hypothetical protein
MPIEIKELNIRINVNDKPATSDPAKKGKEDKESIVAACVEQVVEILKKNQER